MQKTKIKASSVTSLTDARYFAAREVEWLGFRLMGSPEEVISLNAAKAIAEWVDGVKIVGEFEFATAEEIMNAHQSLPFDTVQIGMYFPLSELDKLAAFTIIKEVVIGDGTTGVEIEAHLKEYSRHCQYFLLDFTKSGYNWSRLTRNEPVWLPVLKNIGAKYMTILSIDFDAGSAEEIINTLRPVGVALAGGAEEKIGLKSFDELDEILDALEQCV